MALNNTVLARIEVPTKEDLRLPCAGAIPRHPGHNWDDPANQSKHTRIQVLKSESVGKKFGLVPSGAAARPNDLPSVSSAGAARLHGSLQSTVQGTQPEHTPDNTMMSSNKYDLAGRKLSFKAYFTERVPESPIEKVRTRFVNVQFFLEDETFAVFEPVIPSSGLNGGYLLRRTRVPLHVQDAERRAANPTDYSRFMDLATISEKHVTILDLNVGRPVNLFNTEYHLHACDDYTRRLLRSVGVEVPEDGPAPEDRSFVDYRKKMTGSNATLPMSSRLDPMRAPKGPAVRQKVANVGIVLRFFAIWDEETTNTCEHRERKFEFHYFMEDDTVSLRERNSAATGGEIIARHFLKRIKIPKSGDAAEVVDAMLASGKEVDFYRAHELNVGQTVSIFGRMLKLVDADDATRAYYKDKFGVVIADPIIVCTVKPTPPPQIKADSTDLALLRHEPGKSISTLVLKFELALDNPETADDALRRFVLTFYGSDGEIAIGELVQRNSGFGGGRVLKKSILRRPEDGKVIGLDDLVEGAILRVYGRTFRITALSPRAQAYAEHPEEDESNVLHGVTPERLKQLINTFRDHVMGRYITLAEAFRVFDQDSDGKLTEFELRTFLAKHDMTRNEAEAVAMINAFNGKGDGLISFQDFVHGCTYGVKANALAEENVSNERAHCRDVANRQVLSVAHRVLLAKLRAKFDARHLNLFEMFRHMSTMPRKWPQVMAPDEYARNGARVTLNALTNAEKDCVVTPVQFRRVLVERIGMNVSKGEMGVLLSCFYPDLPESEYESCEDVDALPPRALTLPDFHRIMCSNLKAGSVGK